MTTCICDNCDWTGSTHELGADLLHTPGLKQRLDPGAVVPIGECPRCHALAYPATTHYTVLLQRPDYIAENYGEDTYLWHGAASSPAEALALARTAAIATDDADCEDPTDYRYLILLAGIHDDLNPERN